MQSPDLPQSERPATGAQCYLCGNASQEGLTVSGYAVNVKTSKTVHGNAMRTTTTYDDVLRIDDFIDSKCSGAAWARIRRRRLYVGAAGAVISLLGGILLSHWVYGVKHDPVAPLVLVWPAIVILIGVFIFTAVQAARRVEAAPAWIIATFGPLLAAKRGRNTFWLPSRYEQFKARTGAYRNVS